MRMLVLHAAQARHFFTNHSSLNIHELCLGFSVNRCILEDLRDKRGPESDHGDPYEGCHGGYFTLTVIVDHNFHKRSRDTLSGMSGSLQRYHPG